MSKTTTGAVVNVQDEVILITFRLLGEKDPQTGNYPLSDVTVDVTPYAIELVRDLAAAISERQGAIEDREYEESL